MSRNFAVLEKSSSAIPFGFRGTPATDEPVVPGEEFQAGSREECEAAPEGEFVELIGRLFRGNAVVAVACSGTHGAVGICADLAAELAATGRRVVIVDADRLLKLNPRTFPDETAVDPGSAPNVWHWPAAMDRRIEFFRSPDPDRWLDVLRQRFDAVLLSCAGVGVGAARIAAMADAGVIVAEAGRTTKQRIRHDLDVLKSSGVKMAGCILVRRR